MYLIVGLGNPGKEYEKTRHNAGFLAVDILRDAANFPALKTKKDFEGMFAKGEIGGEPVIVLKPLTYMNLSGHSVQKVAHYFDIPLENIIVLHDDIDLPLETVRIKKGGSSGGQNGVKSILATMGDGFIRVRIGVGLREGKDAAGHVLSTFNKEEWKMLKGVLEKIPEVVQTLLEEGLEVAQNKFN